MKAAGDKMVTTDTATQNPCRKGGKKGPIATVKFGSASVPIYLSESKGRKRYFIAHYREGKRIRKAFLDLAAAKKEAMFVAQRIQSGMQHVTDLKPHERDNYKKAIELLDGLRIPLVAAVEDYVQARSLAESESLTSMANDYRRVFNPLTRRATVPELVLELLAARKQDGASKAYVSNLKTVLTRFGKAFPGEILGISSSDIDGWLRGLNLSVKSRNGMLICVKVLFSFARSQNCLPAEHMTAAEQVNKVKIKNDDDVSVWRALRWPEVATRTPRRQMPSRSRVLLLMLLGLGLAGFMMMVGVGWGLVVVLGEMKRAAPVRDGANPPATIA